MPNPSKPDLAAILQSAAPNKGRRLRYALAAGLVLIGLVVWSALAQKARAQNQPAPFATEPLARDSIALTITATGNLEPTNEVTVGSELSGTTLEVYVDTNDHVTKGQPLARLDTSKLTQQTEVSRATLRSAEASVAQAKATLQETQATLARAKELRRLSNGKLPSQADYDAAIAAADRAQAALLTAEAAVAQAQAQVRANETDLGKAIIKSPIDGIVLTRAIEPGQTVAASFTAPELFVIAEQLEHMKLKVSVAEADIGRLKAGQKATFTVDAWPDRSYTATVLKVAYGSSVTNNVVTYETELEVDNADLSLRPGMTATADIRVAESTNVFVVPPAALRFDPATATATLQATAPKKSFVQSLIPTPPRPAAKVDRKGETAKSGAGNARVWVLRDGQAQPVPVRLGLTDGRKTEISGAQLEPGLPIIVRAQ
ncbi:efflux RND transporter periplasmic adaptor subunit [Opitutus sp. ER46]|uniref:efflux RND transporter periplasmic adaptor subunit n=1 Tax=Opitutus sp. ER46 TaxID=2161864 RepID=UPI000D303D1B|nr:efflux RND transporter periplasmic adaptor subunit [Opitutus sp. ER46]PTX96501.1 efflux RND transporter periplasmic adaptor subunit [Opitutus sp. ER46]